MNATLTKTVSLNRSKMTSYLLRLFYESLTNFLMSNPYTLRIFDHSYVNLIEN